MAIMTPELFPKELANDPKRNAERKVFNALRDFLPAEFHAYYSRPWWGLDASGGEKHGEADFVVAHPDKGVIFLEVKGGRVSFEPSSDTWSSTDQHGISHRIKDPIDQAMKCLHSFLGMFKQDQIWPRGLIKITYAAILPDTHEPPVNKQVVGKHPKGLFLFGNKFPEGLEEWVDDRLQRGGQEVGPGPAGMQVIRRIVADPTKLSFPLRSVLDGEVAQMDQYLVGVQFHVLVSVQRNARSVVFGGAGTGKTVVAVELASRLAQQNLNVLFLARSENLRAFIGRMLPIEGIDIMGWNEFNSQSDQVSRWDWVIVDEAQDLNHADITQLGRYTGTARIAVFLDSNQAIINDPRQISERLNAEELWLSINLRNTKSIARVTSKLFEGDLPETIGPEGETPSATTDVTELVPALIEHIRGLLKAGIRRQQVSVITDGISLRNRTLTALNSADLKAARLMEWEPSSIVVETIEDFKGLESDYLIVMVENPANLSVQLSYVAASRARSRLHLIAQTDTGLLMKSLREASKG